MYIFVFSVDLGLVPHGQLVIMQVAISPGVAPVGVPVMRPLTPASMGASVWQVEHQLKELDLQLETYQSGLTARCEGLRVGVCV